MFFNSIRRAKETEGFTLIELLITVVILAVIMGIAIPVYINNKNSADDTAAKTEASLLGKTIADGIGTGSITGYTGTADGTTPLTGTLTTQVGSQAIGDAKVYYDSVGETWCVSKKVGSSIWMSTSVNVAPTSSLSECTSSTDAPGGPVTFSYATGAFDQGVNYQLLSPTTLGGSGIKTYSITAGSLPTGVTFDPSTGAFTGPLASAWNFVAASITSVAAGQSTSTCALTTSGAVKCWGYNSNGQLGNGTTTDSLAPVNVIGLSSGVTQISVGNNFACAVTSAHIAKCWGYNGYGQLGDGTATDSSIPVTVAGIPSGVNKIATGQAFTCALTTTGAVKCWGDNGYGQLGDGTNTTNHTPVSVSGLTSGVTAIDNGSEHACAITSSGGVKCWGYNSLGGLGNGTNTDSNVPVSVTGLSSGVTFISAGSSTDYSCAVASGAAKCWGGNANGNLGDGTNTDSNTPVSVTGLSSGVTQISAGTSETCALVSGGVKCWGANDSGQLGDGTITSTNTPVDVVGLSSGVTSISEGSAYSCAVISNVAKCWGFNSNGQLGDGTTIDSGTGTPVTALVYNTSAQPGFPASLTVHVSDTSGTGNANITLTAP